MKKVKLSNGIEMPLIGFGTFQITDLKVAEESVRNALKAGYRLIDTAQIYMNEEAVGRGIKTSGVDRKDIFVTTKIWIQNISYDGVMESFEGSLRRLGLEYVDLLLIHQPYNDIFGAWRAMEELLEKGKVRAIGVSNFIFSRALDLMTFNKVSPVVDQIEINPFFQRAEEIKLFKEKNIVLEAWSPFAQGKDGIFTNPILVNIAKKHNKTVAQVILNWLTSQGIVVIPKTTSAERMKENLDIFDFELDESDLNEIKKLDKGVSQVFDQNNPNAVSLLSTWKLPENY